MSYPTVRPGGHVTTVTKLSQLILTKKPAFTGKRAGESVEILLENMKHTLGNPLIVYATLDSYQFSFVQ